MARRVREAGENTGDNITDALRIEALGDLADSLSEVEALSAELSSARSEHSNRLKKWKKRGLRLEPLKRALRERMLDPDEVLADEREYIRLRALQNMPTFQQDLMSLLEVPVDIDAERKAEIQRQRWHDDGAFSGRNGTAREANPHEVGSEAHQSWDRGWLNDMERIAKAMGEGEKPAPVNPPAQKPKRKAPTTDDVGHA